MSFLYSSSSVLYDGLYLGEYIQIPVIYMKGYGRSYKSVYIDDIFETWFKRGLLGRASLNEQVLFDLEFGDGEYFKLLSFVKMLEKRAEDDYNREKGIIK